MVPRSQRVLKYLCRCGRWCLSSPVSFPCRGENISSLPHTLEKTNTFGSANAVWNAALIFGWCRREPAQLKRNDPFPCFHPSVGAPHDPASAWPAEDKSHRGSDRNPSRALQSRRDYQPLGSYGSELLAGEEENKQHKVWNTVPRNAKKGFPQTFQTALGRGKGCQEPRGISWPPTWFCTILPLTWALRHQVHTKYHAALGHILLPVCALEPVQEKEERDFYIPGLLSYTAAMRLGLSAAKARCSQALPSPTDLFPSMTNIRPVCTSREQTSPQWQFLAGT